MYSKIEVQKIFSRLHLGEIAGRDEISIVLKKLLDAYTGDNTDNTFLVDELLTAILLQESNLAGCTNHPSCLEGKIEKIQKTADSIKVTGIVQEDDEEEEVVVVEIKL
ncbi:MAG: hypothetical protein V1770_00835 [bacterium]